MMYRGAKMKMTTTDFSSETTQASKQWSNSLKKTTVNLEFYTQQKISFKNKGEIKTFSNTQHNSLPAGAH